MVSVFYFTPLPGFFSPFPLGTCSLSVTREYLALRDGPRGFQQNFSCSVVLRIPTWVFCISLTGLSPSLVILSRIIQLYFIFLTLFMLVLQPQSVDWFGLFPLRSPLLRESIFLSFPLVTKMFQFARLLSLSLCIHDRISVHYYWWVPPFGNLRIIAYLQLPEAYRCSSRPSSASSAKASAMRPY